MKKLIFAVTVTTMVVAGVAAANSTRKPTDREVEQAIDSRLHAMLVKLNAEKK
jgi:nitrous oxide reductase accessory protein NosL